MTNSINNCNRFNLDDNDSISYVIDSILGSPGLKKAYSENSKIDWIIFIGNKDMEDGIRELPPIEQEIVKLYFLEGKKLIDIASELDMPIELLCGHIKSMKVRLRAYV